MRRAAGFTMIELLIVIAIITIIAAIAVPMMNRSRIAANETSAVAGLKAIAHAEVIFRQGHGEYADWGALVAGDPPYVSDSEVAAGEKDGYTFEIIAATSTAFQAIASPVTFGKTGVRHFFIDESGVVRFTVDGSEPGADSPTVE